MGQALFSNEAARGGLGGRGNHRSKRRSRNRGGKCSSRGNPQAPTQDSPSAFDKVRGKCIRCLELGHHWNPCKAHISLLQRRHQTEVRKAKATAVRLLCVVLQSACLVRMMTRAMRNVAKIWARSAYRSMVHPFHIIHSADLLSDVRLCGDKVRTRDNHLVDKVGYGTLTAVVSPGGLTGKLLDVAYVPDIAFNLFSLMTCLLYTSPSPRD